MYDLLIKNGMTYTEGDFYPLNVAVKDGKIASILAQGDEPEAAKVVDATGRHVFPGFIDPHCHMRDPGLTHKEDYYSGSMAAANSGITMFFAQPNVNPVPNTLETYMLQVEEAKKKAIIDFCPNGAALGNADDVREIAEAGTSWYKIFEKVATYPYNTSAGTTDTHTIYQAFRNIAATGKYCAIHPFDENFFNAAVEECKAEGLPLTLENVRHRWYSDEEMSGAAYQLAYFARKAGMKWYALHVWMPGYIDLVRMLKKEGKMTIVSSCEYMPAINAPDIIYNADTGEGIMVGHDARPDLEKIWEGVRDGTIDMIGSDHAPHAPHEYDNNNPLSTGAGFAMLDFFGHMLVSHMNEGCYDLQKLVEITSINVAKTFGMYPHKGSNIVGTDADFTIVDLNEEWEITLDYPLYTKTRINPYVGRKVKGKVKNTVVRGRVIMTDNVVDCEPGWGRYYGDRFSY